jgi:hypothetical protein
MEYAAHYKYINTDLTFTCDMLYFRNKAIDDRITAL